MSLRKKFKTDTSTETDGIWLEYGEGQRIKIARAGGANTRFRTEGQKILKKYRNQLRLGVMPDEIQQRVARELYGKTIILDWEGITEDDCGIQDESTEIVECSLENVVKLLENLPMLFENIQENAQNSQLFLQAAREEDVGN
jgi:hypothetical protein